MFTGEKLSTVFIAELFPKSNFFLTHLLHVPKVAKYFRRAFMSNMASLFEKTPSLEAYLKNISLSSYKTNIPSCASTAYEPQRIPDSGLELEMKKLSDEFLAQQTWVHSAGKMLRHVVGLYITPENYKTLFLSFDTEFEARHFAGEVLRTLSLAPVYLAGEETLHTLQEK